MVGLKTHTNKQMVLGVRSLERRLLDHVWLHVFIGVRCLHKLLEQVALFEAFERVGRHQVEDLGRALGKERRRKLRARAQRDFQQAHVNTHTKLSEYWKCLACE